MLRHVAAILTLALLAGTTPVAASRVREAAQVVATAARSPVMVADRGTLVESGRRIAAVMSAMQVQDSCAEAATAGTWDGRGAAGSGPTLTVSLVGGATGRTPHGSAALGSPPSSGILALVLVEPPDLWE